MGRQMTLACRHSLKTVTLHKFHTRCPATNQHHCPSNTSSVEAPLAPSWSNLVKNAFSRDCLSSSSSSSYMLLHRHVHLSLSLHYTSVTVQNCSSGSALMQTGHFWGGPHAHIYIHNIYLYISIIINILRHEMK